MLIEREDYHSRRVEEIPSQSWQKAEIHDSVASKAIPCHAAMTKKQLLDTVATVKTKFIKYRVDAAGCVVLWLPPYHCEFNLIELIRAQIKNVVAAMNTTFKTKEVHRLLLAEVQKVTSENWAKAVQHVKGVVTHFWEMRRFSAKMEPIIINLGSDNSKSESELSGIEPLPG